MATITLAEMLQTLDHFSPSETHTIHRRGEDGVDRITIFTDTNQYNISLSDGYLGCTATTRKPRAGEEWSRGNDLRDGKPTHETWNAILGDIVSYEMVRVHRADPLPDALPQAVAAP